MKEKKLLVVTVSITVRRTLKSNLLILYSKRHITMIAHLTNIFKKARTPVLFFLRVLFWRCCRCLDAGICVKMLAMLPRSRCLRQESGANDASKLCKGVQACHLHHTCDNCSDCHSLNASVFFPVKFTNESEGPDPLEQRREDSCEFIGG
jgi:hypothetical protein